MFKQLKTKWVSKTRKWTFNLMAQRRQCDPQSRTKVPISPSLDLHTLLFWLFYFVLFLTGKRYSTQFVINIVKGMQTLTHDLNLLRRNSAEFPSVAILSLLTPCSSPGPAFFASCSPFRLLIAIFHANRNGRIRAGGSAQHSRPIPCSTVSPLQPAPATGIALVFDCVCVCVCECKWGVQCMLRDFRVSVGCPWVVQHSIVHRTQSVVAAPTNTAWIILLYWACKGLKHDPRFPFSFI